MSKEHILTVEDEQDIFELLRYNLLEEGFRVTGATCGEDVLLVIRSDAPDLILLDLMLPGIDGLEVCRILKEDPATAPIPIIMLTAKGEEIDIVTGLELGADDYITKPFSPRVLVTRIKAVLRRKIVPTPEDKKIIKFNDLEIHSGRHEVQVAGQPVTLTFTEFGILHFLAARPGWVFTRGQIVEAVRGDDYSVTDRSVDFQIVGLRKKLGSSAGYIQTVRGVGYKFSD
ncbi:MAG: response regulator transcription factor [Nitrospinota bacterium]|nr:response regulator transcription factor [Nitrospinota bacterium]